MLETDAREADCEVEALIVYSCKPIAERICACMSGLTAHQSLLCLRKARAFIKPPLSVAATTDQMDSAGGKRAHAVKQEQSTARYVAQIRLGPETVTQKQGSLPTEDPLKLTLVYSVEGFDSLSYEHLGISL